MVADAALEIIQFLVEKLKKDDEELVHIVVVEHLLDYLNEGDYAYF
jgi:hypothetical protein